MSFSQQSLSSFTPYRDSKSPNLFGSEFDFPQFSRLNLNSNQNDSCNQSYRSNASLALNPDSPNKICSSPKNHFDLLSMRSRNRKKSIEIGIRPSQPGNMTFLNNSLLGKSQLNHHQDFNFPEIDELGIQKQLSEKSCPVRNEELVLQQKKSHQEGYDHNDDFSGPYDRSKITRKFKKTKNYLRTLSSYLHKYIRYNKKVREMVLKYYLQSKRIQAMDEQFNDSQTQLEAEQFYNEFLEWVGSLNMTNFTEYQKVWTTDHKFLSIYRQISYTYYAQEAFCDIQHSRLTSKQIIQEYLPQFIEGLLNPKQFTHFKNQ